MVMPRRARIKDPALLARLKLECDECEITGETGQLHLHHVIFRSDGGDDLRSNIVCLAGWLHDDYHRGKGDSRELLGALLTSRRPDVIDYINWKLGSTDALSVWLERHGQ